MCSLAIPDGELLMPFLVNTNLTGLGSPRIYYTFWNMFKLLFLDLNCVFLQRRHPLAFGYLPLWCWLTYEWRRCCYCSLISQVRPLQLYQSLSPLSLSCVFVNLPLPSLCLSWKPYSCVGPVITRNSPQRVEFSLEDSSGYVRVNVWYCGWKSWKNSQIKKQQSEKCWLKLSQPTYWIYLYIYLKQPGF